MALEEEEIQCGVNSRFFEMEILRHNRYTKQGNSLVMNGNGN